MKDVLKLRANTQELMRISAWIEQLMPNPWISSSVLELICEEVFVNIVSYAFDASSDNDKAMIQMIYEESADRISISFIDPGTAFDPRSLSQSGDDTDLDNKRIGGVGWQLIRHYIDELSYQRLKNQNYLKLIKYKDLPR